MSGDREQVVVILDPDAEYGAELIEYYFTHHGLRSLLAFTVAGPRRPPSPALRNPTAEPWPVGSCSRGYPATTRCG